METLGDRTQRLPAPPRYVFEALTQPHRDPVRPWLTLLDDEVEPKMIETQEYDLVVWSSIWVKRPLARIRFEIRPGDTEGTKLRFLLTDDADPGPVLVGHMRKRVNTLVFGELRFTFGQ